MSLPQIVCFIITLTFSTIGILNILLVFNRKKNIIEPETKSEETDASTDK